VPTIKNKPTQKLKVMLVVPNMQWACWDINTLWHYWPYGLCLLAAMVEDLCEITIVDANQRKISEDQFRKEVQRKNPDIVGITVLMDQYGPAGHKAAAIVKDVSPKSCVFIGGVYATMNAEDVIRDKNIDYVFIGESEFTFRDFVQHRLGQKKDLPSKGLCYRQKGRIINTGSADFIQDLDQIPPPAYHLIDFHEYSKGVDRKSVDSPRAYPYARIVTSRGCPVGCNFCQVEFIMGKKFRARSAKNVLKEIAFLKETYGVKSLIFDDDNLLMDKKRAVAIFQGMIDQGLAMPWTSIGLAVFKLDEELIKLMRKSGCSYISVAIESGNKRVLKEIIRKPVNFDYAKKMIKAAQQEGIYVAGNFIVGFPTETWGEIRETVQFAQDSGIDYMKLFAAIPLRHTRLWDLCVKEKAFKKGFNENDKRWSTGQIETPNFSADDLTILRAYEWDRVNFTDPQKRERTAKMMGVTEEELLEIRMRTLKNAIKNIRDGQGF